MKLWQFGFILLLCLSSLTSYSQKMSTNKRAQSLYQEATQQLSLQKHSQAIDNLQKAIAIDSKFATAHQTLGDIYRNQSQYQKAILNYQKVVEIDPTLTPLTQFALGESLLAIGDYRQALIHLLEYGKQNLNAKSRLKVNKLIADCEFSLQYNKPRQSFELNRLKPQINTSNDEYFPKLTADNNTIIFTRKVNNQENFYLSQFDNNNWTEAHKLQGEINSDNFNEGAHCISPDGKYLFFTGCNRPGGLGSCDIYISKNENGRWSRPFNLGAPINTKGWESQPAISADGKTLYFVSNRAGGFGGTDIWKSQLGADGKWLAPINLGANINTAFDESAPFIHADNKTLYFSSDGWPGFGKQDLHFSILDSTNNWSSPQNLGASINNHFNQTSFYVSMDGGLGFIAAQDSSLQQDIFSFDVPKDVRPQPVAYIKGTIIDATQNEPLMATISVTNTENERLVFEGESDYIDGKFIATLPLGNQYAVHIQKKGYLFYSKQYDLRNQENENKSFEDLIKLQPIQKDAKVLLDNIYFETDKYTLLPSSFTELKVLLLFMKTNPTVRIEISGHTDNTGNSNYNQKLSENRAKAVKDYLVNNGIAANRLHTIGYGDAKPIAENSTAEGKQKNRRTEIKIIQ